jgi:predicted alpha/beta-fold hydrolase
MVSTSHPAYRVTSDFVPRRGLRGAHAQTLAAWALRRRHRLPAPEDRYLEVDPVIAPPASRPEGWGKTEVLLRCHWQANRRDALTAIVVHGLEGSSESTYAVGTADKAWAAGMNVVRMNVRTCGGTEDRCATLYNSGMSHDVDAVVRALITQENLERIALIGFSMGGNMVLKLAGDWGNEAPRQVRAVAAVSAAMDLAPSADALHERQNRLYEWNFLRELRRRMERKAQLFPGLYEVSALRGLRSIREFDDRITARYCGFAGAADYYERASASRVLDRIAIPTLVIHALDDPFIRVLAQTRAKLNGNRHIHYVETAHGGHCGFLAAPNGYDGRWAEREVVRFVQDMSQ